MRWLRNVKRTLVDVESEHPTEHGECREEIMQYRFLILTLLISAAPAAAQDRAEYLNFIKAQAAELRAGDKLPATRAEWDARREEIRQRLAEAWGWNAFPKIPCPLQPKVLGVLQRDGYRVEKIIFQTLPGVWMTANAYVPDKPGKLPALLAVHGHWRGARLDPVVQKRCIGPAKLGYFVLAVDAFGAGERGLSKNLGEYHGEMVAGTLFPIGQPLSGIQVYENMRAVDYLQSRPEVDGKRIAITGASGGGNQTMYAGAWDERFGAVVPVCSVGNYQAYLGAACCMCEVVPGALRFTEESGVLGLTAPRGLMVINVTKDGIQFSVGEAKKSIAATAPVFKLYGQEANLRHTVFDWHHDYSQAMREALYGWLAKHLRGEGDGSPIPEPPFKAEDPESLRCFPGDSRPTDWLTIPKFAAREGRKLLAARQPIDPTTWPAVAKERRLALAKALGGFPKAGPLDWSVKRSEQAAEYTFHPETGLTLRAVQRGPDRAERLAIVLDLDGAEQAAKSPHAQALTTAGWSVVTLDLRATGALARPGDLIGRAPDHTTAQWGLWIGRPLLGQWAHDVRRLLDGLEAEGRKLPPRVAVVGRGPAGLVALCVSALDKRVTDVSCIDMLASYVTDVPYQGQRVGILVPGILRDVGDVSDIAALCAPRRVTIIGGVWGGGGKLSAEELRTAYANAARAWKAADATKRLVITTVAQ
jgi:cephalosporin-C deacetylase-like acetyl esterase